MDQAGSEMDSERKNLTMKLKTVICVGMKGNWGGGHKERVWGGQENP